MLTFKDLGLEPNLIQVVEELGFKTPTDFRSFIIRGVIFSSEYPNQPPEVVYAEKPNIIKGTINK